MAGTDARGRLGAEPFGYRATKDGRVMITFRGRTVTVVAGRRAGRLLAALEDAAGDPDRVQLLLAKATGHFRHGTER